MSEAKRWLRARMIAVRDALPADDRARASEAIAETFLAAWEAGAFGGATVETTERTLVCYLPFRSEVDVMPIVRDCWSRGIRVLAPRVDKRTKTMTLHAIAGEGDVRPGAYGIREPAPQTPLAALSPGTVMLVPGLAFDAAGRRLGYGGGYFDRLLERRRAETASGAIALVAPAFSAQLVDVVPTEPHDARVRFLVTESGVIDCSQHESSNA